MSECTECGTKQRSFKYQGLHGGKLCAECFHLALNALGISKDLWARLSKPVDPKIARKAFCR